jgi:hypothetical protein
MYRSRFLFIITFALFTNSVINCQSIKIFGKVYDKDNNRVITNGVIFLNPENKVVTTDQKGEFSLSCSPGKKHITTRVLGFKPVSLNLNIISDTIINIYLQILPYELREVTITGDSIKNVKITSKGSFIITPAVFRETPKLFSEPDLLKSLQLLPGVISGKEGTSDMYIRGGGAGQNIVIANGCYFFLPGHLLGIVSPFDLDFLESAELYKDYLPSDIGGGASSVINLDFRKPRSDSLSAQLRLGLLSSGIILDLPFKNLKWDLTVGLKRSNYSLYAPLLKKIVPSDVSTFLPPDKYSFYDGFLRLSHNSPKWGRITYLFFGNYDNGKQETRTTGQNGDTITKYTDGVSSGWNSMVHALQWEPVEKGSLKWKFDLNYNRIAIGRSVFSRSEESTTGSDEIVPGGTMYSFYPAVNNFGTSLEVTSTGDKFTFSTGLSDRLRLFASNNFAVNIVNGEETRNDLSTNDLINETALFFSSGTFITRKLKLDAGLRLTGLIARDANFLVAEPRIRLSYNEGSALSPHLNYVRLSQNDHSIEGSNTGLRTLLWLPPDRDFGPEISDVLSVGVQGEIENDFVWMLDGYYKKMTGMVDFKPGASFIFDTSFVDLLDRVRGRAYGLEAGVIKRTGHFTGSVSYTYSRSKREWGTPEGLIWIPSISDRPHNFNMALKYYFRKRTSFGLNFIYQSGVPATIYMHETSYGEFFETKNNIRFFEYHRLDLSIRQVFYKHRFTIFLDADIYNVYNHRNTFYFKKIYDNSTKSYYFKNISLFPIMPSLTLTIKY